MRAGKRGEPLQFPALIGDIGGTNARFGLVEDATAAVRSIQILPVDAHPSAQSALDSYITDNKIGKIGTFILAIAGAREGDAFALTNGQWRFDADKLMDRYGLKTVVLMNDFSAQALATLAVQDRDLIHLGGKAIEPGAPKLIVGPGTGLGVANLIRSDSHWVILPGEGGHMDMGPRTDREMAIWPHLKRRGGRVSGECVLSGSGLENLYQAIAATGNFTPNSLPAPEITSRATAGDNPCAVEAVERFVELLGRLAGDLALVTLPKGGVYLAGGIVTKLVETIVEGPFREAFEDKAPHGHLMKSLPVMLINHQAAALEGMALFARSPQLFSMEQAVIVHRPNTV